MSEFFLKVKKYDDAFRRPVVERKRVTVRDLTFFFNDFIFGDIDIHRVDSIHIERLKK